MDKLDWLMIKSKLSKIYQEEKDEIEWWIEDGLGKS